MKQNSSIGCYDKHYFYLSATSQIDNLIINSNGYQLTRSSRGGKGRFKTNELGYDRLIHLVDSTRRIEEHFDMFKWRIIYTGIRDIQFVDVPLIIRFLNSQTNRWWYKVGRNRNCQIESSRVTENSIPDSTRNSYYALWLMTRIDQPKLPSDIYIYIYIYWRQVSDPLQIANSVLNIISFFLRTDE